MASKKGGLGRGLDSLFGDSTLLQTPAPAEKPAPAKAKTGSSTSTKTASKAAATDNVIESVVYIKLNDIKPNVDQPRKNFDDEALESLAASIKEHGVIQPVLVRPAAKGYELVAGERRWRAARIAGLKQIPAIVRELDEKTNAFFALIENMQREDLNSIEEAEGIKEIMDKYGFTQEETAKAIGKSRPYVANAIRLLSLPEEVKELVKNGKLSQGHARAIAGLAGKDVQISVAKKAADAGWSVRQIENVAKTAPKKKPAKKKAAKKDAETKSLEERLSEGLGTKVTIEGSAKKGKIVVEYYSADELERIIEQIEK